MAIGPHPGLFTADGFIFMARTAGVPHAMAMQIRSLPQAAMMQTGVVDGISEKLR